MGTHSLGNNSSDAPQVPARMSTTVVRAGSVRTPSNRQSVEQVELKSDGESLSPPSPRVLVETRYLLAHEVPTTTTLSGVQRSRSLMTHADMNPSKRFSVERGSWDSSENTGYSRTPSFSFTTDSNATSFNRPLHQFQSDLKGSERIPMTVKPPATKNNHCHSWEEMDVDSTLEMLKEMQDQLDRSLALRNQRTAPFHSTTSSTSTASEWKPTFATRRNRDVEDAGNFEGPGRTLYSVLGQDMAAWNEQNSAFKTTPNRKGIVRSASTYSPVNYKSSASVDDDSQRNQYVFRTPTASFSSGSGVTRSSTSERLHGGTKAIYTSRGPFRHNVSTDHLLTRVHPATIARGATSRSYDFEIEHRRCQSAEQNVNDNIDAGRQPSVAERVKLFQNAIENHCK
ncbi:unnamed protein product [Rodentolepis nana]|uniref:Uncharacterized protein n=1 Tax=Rodentolepis nana TaxID=102285 RepID=A0A158QJ69_RODNA|nr:unnamed protein product [Rodentolepis nana]